MKKRLQKQIKALAEEIAHDSESNWSTADLKEHARDLYEKLCIYEYLEQQLMGESAQEKPSAKQEESLDSKSYRERNWFSEPEPVPQTPHEDELIEPVIEKIKDLVAQMPGESQQVDELLKEVLPERKFQKNDLEDLVAAYQEMPVFEKKETAAEPEAEPETEPEPEMVVVEEPEEAEADQPSKLNDVNRPKSLNESLSSGLNVGLNDRLAFIKHLFNGSNEDYSRVMSQISSFSSFEEAETFIKIRVKPEYGYWTKKEEYAERFMNILERNFA